MNQSLARPNTAVSRLDDGPDNHEEEDDDDGGLYTAGGLNSASSSRARMLAQQREIALKKRQNSISSGGMVRSSLDSNLPTNSPARISNNNDGQFTPAVRQFSAPKSVREFSE
jgi:hypothetical protein